MVLNKKAFALSTIMLLFLGILVIVLMFYLSTKGYGLLEMPSLLS